MRDERCGIELIKLSFTPKSIISPIPYFAVVVFLVSHESLSSLQFPYSLYLFVLGIFLTVFSNSVANLWNHVNDINDDNRQGRLNILTENRIDVKNVIAFSIVLYEIFLVSVYVISDILGRPLFIFFGFWAVITWLYSDTIFLGRLFGFRLKTHFVGEFLTYIFAYPLYTLGVWLIYTDLNVKSVVFSLLMGIFAISGLLLKDLKDISADRMAGLKTFGVVFPPSTLLKFSCYLLILYYILIFVSAYFKIFNYPVFLITLPFIVFFKNTLYHFWRKKWRLELSDSNAIGYLLSSAYESFILFGFGSALNF